MARDQDQTPSILDPEGIAMMATKKSKNTSREKVPRGSDGKVLPPPRPPRELDVKLPGERSTIRDVVDPNRPKKRPRPDIEEWYRAYNEQEEAQQRPTEFNVPNKSQTPSILDPEGIAMMAIAVFIDLLGLIGFIPLIGQVLSYIPDMMGIVIIGGWAWFRMGKIPFTKKMRRYVTRFGLTALLELIPVVGILPMWSIYVFLKLRK